MLRGDLDLQKFGLTRSLQPSMLHLIVLGFNILPLVLDERSQQERFSDPKIADVAWSPIEISTFKWSEEKRTHLFHPATRLVPMACYKSLDCHFSIVLTHHHSLVAKDKTAQRHLWI
jgi:hypothetical protein